MNPEVRRRWIPWSAQFEGRVAWMYLDIIGKVTTGVGNLIDPASYALTLPWQKPDGQRATADEISAEWRKVKQDTSLAQRGYHAAEQATKLRLSGSAVDALVLAKLDANDKVLAGRFRNWDALPWQAQMVVHSLAWAMGPAFNFPRFKAAIEAGNWASAAAECYIPDTNNPGLKPRNAADRALLLELASGQQAPSQAPTSPPVALPVAAPSPIRAAPWWWDWLLKLLGRKA